MIWTLKQLMEHCRSVSRETNGGQWVPAKPEPGPRTWRWRAALAVLLGRADAFTWPDDDAETPPSRWQVLLHHLKLRVSPPDTRKRP